MSDSIAILTPDKVIVSHRLAGVGSRAFAAMLDVLFVGVIYSAVLAGLYYSVLRFFPAFMDAASTALAPAVIGGYFILMEGLFRGQTLGKNILRLRVLMADGTPITFPAAVVRNLLRVADFLPAAYLVGAVAIFLNPRAQRIGDLAAGTVVVSEFVPSRGFQPAPHRYGIHPFENHVGELRKMTLEEYLAIKRLCDRFPELPPTTQEASLNTLWKPFQDRHGIQDQPGVHPVYLMEAVVMKYGRQHRLI